MGRGIFLHRNLYSMGPSAVLIGRVQECVVGIFVAGGWKSVMFCMIRHGSTGNIANLFNILRPQRTTKGSQDEVHSSGSQSERSQSRRSQSSLKHPQGDAGTSVYHGGARESICPCWHQILQHTILVKPQCPLERTSGIGTSGRSCGTTSPM